jgi:hypothetical protein
LNICLVAKFMKIFHHKRLVLISQLMEWIVVGSFLFSSIFHYLIFIRPLILIALPEISLLTINKYSFTTVGFRGRRACRQHTVWLPRLCYVFQP